MYYSKLDYQEISPLEGDSIANSAIDVLQRSWPVNVIIAGDTQSRSYPGLFPATPLVPYPIHASIPGPSPTRVDSVGSQLSSVNSFDPYLSNAGASGSSPSHVPFLSPLSSNSSSFGLSMASQSTSAGTFPSVGRSISAGVGATPFVDISPSQQQIPDVGYGQYNDSPISIWSQATYPTITGPQVSHTFPFHRNSGAIQEGYGTYVSSRVHQSPVSFDVDHLLEAGDPSRSSSQEIPGVPAHVISDAQVSSNVPAPRRRRRNPRGRPLPKGANGYVKIEAAWQRLLKRPALPTDEFDALFFPPDQAAELIGTRRRRCRVKASVTRSGLAKWVPYAFDKPCGHELDCADSYRRHIITQHLSCTRGASAKLNDWIRRRLDAVGSNSH